MSDALSWNGNWAWALPLIVVTLLIHVVGLALINMRMVRMLKRVRPGREFFPVFVSVMGITALLAILLLAFEAPCGRPPIAASALCRMAGRPCSIH